MLRILGTTFLVLISTAVVANPTSSGNVLAEAPSWVDPLPSVTVRGADRVQRAEVDEALDRFRSAGLDLPDVEIVFSDSEPMCLGHPGTFDRGVEPWRVSVCSDLAFVLTHELAHAWVAAHFADEDRNCYVRARGLASWSDRSTPWGERGSEDAAFIIQQILMSTTRLPAHTWAERTHAYVLILLLAARSGGHGCQLDPIS